MKGNVQLEHLQAQCENANVLIKLERHVRVWTIDYRRARP